MTTPTIDEPLPETEVETTDLPMGVGRFDRGWRTFIIFPIIGVVIGLIAYLYERNQGLVVTGMRDLGSMRGATWGLYITLVVYFVGVSFAGITIAAFIRLFHLEQLRGIARMAELMTVVALILGALAIVVDLG